MTSPITPPSGASGAEGPAAPARPASPRATRGDFAATLRSIESAPSLAGAGIESTPPPAVHEEMAQASRAHDALAASGREVRFQEGANGTADVALHHSGGARIAALRLQDLYTLIAQEGGG